MANIATMNGTENKKKLKSETLVHSVGANLKTTIHVISCLRVKKG